MTTWYHSRNIRLNSRMKVNFPSQKEIFLQKFSFRLNFNFISKYYATAMPSRTFWKKSDYKHYILCVKRKTKINYDQPSGILNSSVQMNFWRKLTKMSTFIDILMYKFDKRIYIKFPWVSRPLLWVFQTKFLISDISCQ